MGKTNRKIRRHKKDVYVLEIVNGDDAQLKHQGSGWLGNRKMKPFSKVRGKFTPEVVIGNKKPTKREKLITKNANRPNKKSVRFELKQELKKIINDQ